MNGYGSSSLEFLPTESTSCSSSPSDTGESITPSFSIMEKANSPSSSFSMLTASPSLSAPSKLTASSASGPNTLWRISLALTLGSLLSSGSLSTCRACERSQPIFTCKLGCSTSYSLLSSAASLILIGLIEMAISSSLRSWTACGRLRRESASMMYTMNLGVDILLLFLSTIAWVHKISKNWS